MGCHLDSLRWMGCLERKRLKRVCGCVTIMLGSAFIGLFRWMLCSLQMACVCLPGGDRTEIAVDCTIMCHMDQMGLIRERASVKHSDK